MQARDDAGWFAITVSPLVELFPIKVVRTNSEVLSYVLKFRECHRRAHRSARPRGMSIRAHSHAKSFKLALNMMDPMCMH